MITVETPERIVPGLADGFLRSLHRFPDRAALYADGVLWTYESLGRMAGGVAGAIRNVDEDNNPLVGILAHRSVTAYAGVLGTLLAGKGYVPLNPKLPIGRLAKILLQSRTRTLIVGEEAAHLLDPLLQQIAHSIVVLYPTVEQAGMPRLGIGPHRLVLFEKAPQDQSFIMPAASNHDTIAYLLFTSGSTGEPKGVPVRYGNVRSYVQYISRRYEVTEHDRFSQMFDLSFDLSVHDMLVCWERGACLYSVPEHAVMAPAKFIRDHQITMWFSVPSVIGVMLQLGMLKPGSLPSLRGSLFCGEPLPARYARAWQEAAPNSFVENVYGPTETTIAISHYRWDPDNSPQSCLNGIVPIGWIFEGQRTCIVPAGELHPAANSDKIGELCLAGSQVTTGYWNAPDKTAKQFVRLPDKGEAVWYRTGDLVKQDNEGCLYYLGRIDHQVKIMGHRVELQEVEGVLRDAAGTEQVASVAWPVKDGLARGIVAFIAGRPDRDAAELLQVCRERLPDYMVPKRICRIDALPLNLHGKTDRQQLIHLLEEGDQ
jgi:amino acid adenylation domain-containing protein